MTDKQIIIDGVDVSGCPYYIHKDGSCSSHDCECVKCVHNVCFYKDYKAKEQECEELKAKCKKYGEINEQETKDYAELKAERDSYIDKYFLESQKVVNLRKILREIKEIARVGAFYWKHYKEESKRYNEILQKISECEGNDETN